MTARPAAVAARPLPELMLALGDPGPAATPHEWLVTNGLGGHASGTVNDVPARRYHGVFVPNLVSPPGRHVLVPRLDAHALDPDGLAHPLALRGFQLEGTVPCWQFQHGGRRLARRLVMPHGHDVVVVQWRLLEGESLRLRLRPFIAARRQDAELTRDLHDAATRVAAGDGAVGFRWAGGPGLRLQIDADVAFIDAPFVARDVTFAVEQDRGYDAVEHQHSPGCWEVSLHTGDTVHVVASLLDDAPPAAPARAFDAEAARAVGLLAAACRVHTPDDTVETRLVLAADAFVVMPGSRSDEPGPDHDPEVDADLRSVIAGYHWFCDWGRDTMISLEGLTLATGRHAEARAILRTFAGYIRDGLIPNLFPEGARQALYHTVDATLWFFHALDRYAARTGDTALVAELFPRLRDVVARHVRGTHYGIGVDAADGLLRASADGYQLTWMDAKMGDWVVTPRRGKPVEIQALWFNALKLMGAWSRNLGLPDDGFDARAAQVAISFEQRFWSPEHGHLLDVVDGPAFDGRPGGDDPSLRPNQVFAMSLAHPVLDASHRGAVLQAIERHLLTPMGLRTLSPDDPKYQALYQGDLRARDGAYHQGTVWPWLLGHFVDAWLREHGDRARARRFLEAFPAHLHVAGIGQISEVFDADAPHRPGGCIAQAWSVAEVLRAWQLTASPA